MTFLKWLESQQDREDSVGLLAREVHAQWGRSWREVGACFHFGGQNWPKTLSNIHRYLSTKLDYLDSKYECPPPVSRKALEGLPLAWEEWQNLFPGPSDTNKKQ